MTIGPFVIDVGLNAHKYNILAQEILPEIRRVLLISTSIFRNVGLESWNRLIGLHVRRIYIPVIFFFGDFFMTVCIRTIPAMQTETC